MEQAIVGRVSGECSPETAGLVTETGVLEEDEVVALGDRAEALNQGVVVGPESDDLGPQLVEVPLLPHAGPPRGFPVRYHSPPPPIVDHRSHLLLLILALLLLRSAAAHGVGRGQ